MFKRANKVTALLVAAASVMSIVPAMAATRIGTKDGHIKEGAIAFADGKYLYDGYRTNDDDNGIYYNNGSEEKEKFNEDLRDYSLVNASKYGSKYAYAKDGSDQYLIDLSTGKIVDDETPEAKADEVKSKLRTALKKTDRYSATGSWDTITLGDTDNYVSDDGYSLNVFGGQFGDVWYKYSALGDKTAVDTVVGQVADKAYFSVKLPTIWTKATDTVTIGTRAYTGTSLADLQDNIRAGVKADIAANFSSLFDSTTVVIKDGAVVGYAANKGEIAKDNADLVAFATKYGVTLKESAIATATVGAGELNLGVLASATASDSTIAAATTTSGAVTIVGLNAGSAMVTVKDTAANVATISVKVTSTAGVKSISATIAGKYYSAAQVAAALAVVQNTGTIANADLTTFDILGVSDLVTTLGSVGTNPTLSLPEAREALLNYVLYGKKGLAISDTATVRTVLQAKLDAKIAAQQATEVVTVYRGAGDVNSVVGIPNQYQGFVNESGKYIDTSAIANIYVYSKAHNKTVKIKEYNKVNADYDITVGLADLKPLAQDKDNIYALATVVVKEGSAPLETQYFVQKISKAQGTDKDGAFVPKSVDSYQIDNKTIFDNGDSETAYKILVGKSEDGFAYKGVRVKDGALYVTGVKDDKVKVYKVVLKKDKSNIMKEYDKVNADTKIEDVDVYIAKKDDTKDADLKAGTSGTAVAFDAEGNTWIVNKGTITKFNGLEKKDMYTCDRTFDHIDVYDDNNLIVWDKDSDVYSNVAEGTKVTQGEATAVAPAVTTGWAQGTDGTWTFNDATGTKLTSKWIIDKGYWYYLKADGVMATGWLQDPNGGAWYYLNPSSGAMLTGWLKDPNSGLWYYLNPLTGAMLSNTTIDGYQLGGSGAWIQ